MARKTLSERKADKLTELNRIKAELAELESKAAERIGKIALAAGLGDLDIDDASLRKEFEAVASKFRKSEGKQAAPMAATNSAD
ncbi:TraC family protein [Klebsiella pneumoniae]|uniref:TraC family protein n=1 Tax=Klebsiella pneumoniae TaxID=573 RepID=UPI0029DAE933|nr:TraC family protein [Klebsiella pneumoniae]MDX7167911.1 TraC family protein [Klebsiella pneumoniae]